jgi:hypothetical protein
VSVGEKSPKAESLVVKPKRTQPKTPDSVQDRDLFYTPVYATEMILPYIPEGVRTIWEPAAGTGMIAKVLRGAGYNVSETDIRSDPPVNFLKRYECDADAIITNPPFSLKVEFVSRCLHFRKPFALLIPGDFCQWFLDALEGGCRILAPRRRIDFITPTGRYGKDSSSMCHSIWLCHGFTLPKQITVVDLTKKMKQRITGDEVETQQEMDL